MQYFNEATLIYVAQVKKASGSPKELTIEKRIKVKEVRNFSLNFYSSQGTTQRSMRNSKNLVIPKGYSKDMIQDEKRYELLYVVVDGLKYRVQNVLTYFKKDTQVILDVEELR